MLVNGNFHSKPWLYIFQYSISVRENCNKRKVAWKHLIPNLRSGRCLVSLPDGGSEMLLVSRAIGQRSSLLMVPLEFQLLFSHLKHKHQACLTHRSFTVTLFLNYRPISFCVVIQIYIYILYRNEFNLQLWMSTYIYKRPHTHTYRMLGNSYYKLLGLVERTE